MGRREAVFTIILGILLGCICIGALLLGASYLANASWLNLTP